MKLDWQLVTIVLTSSFLGAVLGAIISGIFNLFISNNNFKLKSYEEIVKKRFQAYEQIAAVTLQFKLFIHDEDGIVVPYVFANGMKGLDNFQMLLMESFTYSFWLDEKMGSLVTELNALVYNMRSEAIMKQNSDEYLRKIAALDKEQIRDLSRRLSSQLREDLINIHKIENFVRSKTKSKESFSIKSWKDFEAQ